MAIIARVNGKKGVTAEDFKFDSEFNGHSNVIGSAVGSPNQTARSVIVQNVGSYVV